MKKALSTALTVTIFGAVLTRRHRTRRVPCRKEPQPDIHTVLHKTHTRIDPAAARLGHKPCANPLAVWNTPKTPKSSHQGHLPSTSCLPRTGESETTPKLSFGPKPDRATSRSVAHVRASLPEPFFPTFETSKPTLERRDKNSTLVLATAFGHLPNPRPSILVPAYFPQAAARRG